MDKIEYLYRGLKTHFDYDTFQEGQEEIIYDVMSGKDVLGILPTGSGKSLCFQLPAKLLPGVTIVVSPLISLMIDQVRQVKASYFKEVIAIHSGMNYSERQEAMENLAGYKLIYISPELLQQDYFITALKGLEVSLFAIDEAHCISQWGHDFRPDYLRLKKAISAIGNPPVLALSGTATAEVQNDIMVLLNRPKMVKHIYSMERDNISLVIKHVRDKQEKQAVLDKVIGTYDLPTIIYFSSRKETENIAAFLQGQHKTKQIAFYHAGMDSADRLKVQQQFLHDQLDIICCTSAFGMGINKGNIRLIIHFHLPMQLEGFIQEIGRAGRDGGASVSLLLHAEDDANLPMHIIEHELPTKDEIIKVITYLRQFTGQQINPVKTENILVEKFQITATKWRFIYYHLEEAGMIRENTFISQANKMEAVTHHIWLESESRMHLKYQQLNQVIEWTRTSACLRKSLYEVFQPTTKEIGRQCCSNCSFSFADWYDKQTKRHKRQTVLYNWESALAKILLVGDLD